MGLGDNFGVTMRTLALNNTCKMPVLRSSYAAAGAFALRARPQTILARFPPISMPSAAERVSAAFSAVARSTKFTNAQSNVSIANGY